LIGQLQLQLKILGALANNATNISSCLLIHVNRQDDISISPNSQKALIIEDLLKNKPEGPSHNPVTYTTVEVWDPVKMKHIAKYKPDDVCFGYDKKTLFNMGIRSLDDVRKLLRTHKFEGKFYLGSKKRTYTRQCNRLWARLSPAIKEVKKEGGIGVYRVVHKSVKNSYTLRETNIGFVHAVNYKESQNIARLMFGYLVEDPENIETVFTRFGTEKLLMAYNKKSIEKIDERVKQMQRSIDTAEKSIKKLQNMREAVMNTTLSMCTEDSHET